MRSCAVFLNLKYGVLSNEEMNDMAKEPELVTNGSLRSNLKHRLSRVKNCRGLINEFMNMFLKWRTIIPETDKTYLRTIVFVRSEHNLFQRYFLG